MNEIKYTVGEIRSAGLEAKWGRTSSGAPIIFARMPKLTVRAGQGRDEGWSPIVVGRSANPWYAVDRKMWEDAKREGVREAFSRHTMLGNIFSIPA